MKFNKNKYTKEVSALRSRFRYANKASANNIAPALLFGPFGLMVGQHITNEKIDTILSGYGDKYGYVGKTLR